MNLKSLSVQQIHGVAFLLALFFPHNGPLIFINVILLFYLGTHYHKQKTPMIMMLMVISLFVSFVLSDYSLYSFKSLVRAVFMSLCFLYFPFTKNVQIPTRFYYIAVGVLFASQLAFIFNISPLTSLFAVLFPEGEDRVEYIERYRAIGTTTLGLRFAGLYGNANLTAKYMNIILLAYLLDNRNLDVKKMLPVLLLAGATILLTGSRTGTFIFLLSLLFCIILPKSKNKLGLLILLGIGFAAYSYLASDIDLRGFKLGEGFGDSMAEKTSLVTQTITTSFSIKDILLGNFWGTESGVLMDSDWGDSIFTYGFIFLIFYALFIVHYFFATGKKSRLILLIMLWGISSTVIMSWRTSFVALFILSKFYKVKDERSKLSQSISR